MKTRNLILKTESIGFISFAAILTFLLWMPDLIVAADNESQPAFSVPPEHYPFQFPRDHGSHPDYRIEWWYITGHFNASPAGEPTKKSSRKFGFQATFFRIAGDAPGDRQFYMAHMALTDIRSQKFYHEEKLNHEGWDAGSSKDYLNTHNGNWSLVQDIANPSSFLASLKATIGADVTMKFQFSHEGDPVIFGKNGVSLKGDAPDARSLYITFPKLMTSGTLTLMGQSYDISGMSWMDHEISSSQLAPDQIGWNWASIHLDDGRSVMVYMMRKNDQSKDPYSFFNVIEADNKSVTEYAAKDFSWTPDQWWESEMTGSKYPISSKIRIISKSPLSGHRPPLPEEFHLKPLMKAQEMESKVSNVHYWEGACDVVDSMGVKIGRAYVELTGYGSPLTRFLSSQ